MVIYIIMDLQQQYVWNWSPTITSPLTSPAPGNGWMSISSINQRTEFLSQDQQQWENSAMMLATSEQPKREGQDENTQETSSKRKRREERRKERKHPNKKGGRKERHKMEDFGRKIFRGQSELCKVHHLGLRSLWNNHFEDAKGGNNKQ